MEILDRALSHVKHEVHQQRPYRVGVPSGHITVKLNQNESPFDVPEDLKQTVFAAWKEIAFNRYPAEQPEELVRLIGHTLDWDPEGILIGNGSNELTYTVGLTFISSERRVILPRPMFSFYERVVDIFGGEVVSVPPRKNLQFDTDGILEALHRTKPSMVVITSPNNPTSLGLSLNELRAIADAAPGVVLVDEAYIEFSDEPSMLSVLENYPNTILLRTFSKAFGLAGIRMGYLIAAPELISELLKVRPPFMIDSFSEAAVKVLLEQPILIRDRIASIRSETKILMEALRKIKGMHILTGQANFVTFRPPCDSKKLFKKLAYAGILVRDMSGYPELEGFLRVSTGAPIENRAFLRALTHEVSELLP